MIAKVKWVRGELIGRGTCGRVYLALNATTGEMMAVKQVEISENLSDENDSRQATIFNALKSKSEILKDLDHPNIVPFIGLHVADSITYMVSQWMKNGNILSFLRQNPASDRIKLASQLLITQLSSLTIKSTWLANPSWSWFGISPRAESSCHPW